MNENDMIDQQERENLSGADDEAAWEAAEREAEDDPEGYQEYIMANNDGVRIICNGDDLIDCAEDTA